MNPRLERLLNRWLDGDLDAPEEEALQRLLVEDPEARRAYYELLLDDQLLDEKFGNHEAPSEAILFSASGAPSKIRVLRPLLAIAAIVMFTLFATNFLRKQTPAKHPGPVIAGSIDSRMTIAQRQDSSNWAVGELLRLERGSASIQLNTLVAGNFEGPAAVELVDASGNIRLLEGMASFRVNPGANRFNVQVPGGILNDVNSIFTTEVLSDGTAHVQVESGFLEINPRGGGEPVYLHKGDAVSLEPDGKTMPIRLANQHFRSSLPEQVPIFRDDFLTNGDAPLLDHQPQVGEPWKVISETNPTIIRNHTLDTTSGARRLLASLARHETTGPRSVYIFTFKLQPPERIDDKITRQGGVEYISFTDASGQSILSIFAEASNSHRWQLRDEHSKAVTALTSVCSLWTHSLTLCYDLNGRVTLHDGATAQAPIIAEIRVTTPIPVAGIMIGNRDGGDLAFSGIEGTLLPAPAADIQ